MSPHLFDALASTLAFVAALAAAGSTYSTARQVSRDSGLSAAETISLRAGTVAHQSPGEFLRDGRPAVAPIEQITVAGIEIMKYQVSLADYDRCVKAAACDPLEPAPSLAFELPVTGVSYRDAEAYASWYSRATGESWRLPTDAEWTLAAAERFSGDELAAIQDPENPAIAWIRRYQEEAARNRAPDPTPKARGHYGANSNGLFDLAGNVWEWTSTCYVRLTLKGAAVERTIENCGVHVVEGRHRAYMSNFIRDGKSGGCAVGTPPDNLGFRLVRDTGGRWEYWRGWPYTS